MGRSYEPLERGRTGKTLCSTELRSCTATSKALDLDSGERILRRLSGVQDLGMRQVMNVITTEEVDHVLFGSRWFHKVCEEQKLDSEVEFITRLEKIFALIPRREKVAHELRARAGFTPREIRRPRARSAHGAGKLRIGYGKNFGEVSFSRLKSERDSVKNSRMATVPCSTPDPRA